MPTSPWVPRYTRPTVACRWMSVRLVFVGSTRPLLAAFQSTEHVEWPIWSPLIRETPLVGCSAEQISPWEEKQTKESPWFLPFKLGFSLFFNFSHVRFATFWEWFPWWPIASYFQIEWKELHRCQQTGPNMAAKPLSIDAVRSDFF